MECNHKWQGDCRGVHCLLCGKVLTPDEYVALCDLLSHGNDYII